MRSGTIQGLAMLSFIAFFVGLFMAFVYPHAWESMDAPALNETAINLMEGLGIITMGVTASCLLLLVFKATAAPSRDVPRDDDRLVIRTKRN